MMCFSCGLACRVWQSFKGELMLSALPVAGRCVQLMQAQVASCFLLCLQEFKGRHSPLHDAYLLCNSKYVPLALLVACFAAAVVGSLLSCPIQDLRPPFDHSSGLCTKAFHAFEVKACFSHCTEAFHTRERVEFCPFMFMGWILSL